MRFDTTRPVRIARSLAVRAGEATFRFPAAAVAVVAIAALSNWVVARDLDATDPWFRALLGLTAGAAASVAATLFAESRGAGLGAVRLSGAVGLAVVGSAVGFAHPFLLHGTALTIAILTAVPLAPFIGRGSSRTFWDFSLWTALGIILAWFSVLIFLLGFTAIFEMIRTLFGVGLGSDAYSHLFTTGLTLVGPLFALGRIPHPGDQPHQHGASERLEKAVRPLFEWVTAPLILVAGVIIHVYAAKIVLTGDVPSNEIGWIVLLFSGFVLSLRVGLEPYLGELSQPAHLFARLWAAMLVVPLILFAYALALRVGGQGWTVERYFSAAYGLAAAIAVALQALPWTRGDIRFLVAAPPFLLVLSTVGPWGVADTVGRSQTALIEGTYGDALRAGADATRGLDGPARETLLSRLRALDDVEEADRLGPALARIDGGEAPERVAALRRILGERSAMETASAQETERAYATNDAWDIGGFDRVLPSLDAKSDTGMGSSAWIEDGQLVIRYRERTDRFNLQAAIDPAFQKAASPLLSALVIDLRSDEGRSVRVRVSYARWKAQGVPIALQGWLALRHGEWASVSD